VKGQGLVENVLMLVIIAVALISMFGLLLPVLQGDPCAFKRDSFECKDYKVQQCLKTELYTKDQCVTLVGSGK
jgi:hypothetical protein